MHVGKSSTNRSIASERQGESRDLLRPALCFRGFQNKMKPVYKECEMLAQQPHSLSLAGCDTQGQSLHDITRVSCASGGADREDQPQKLELNRDACVHYQQRQPVGCLPLECMLRGSVSWRTLNYCSDPLSYAWRFAKDKETHHLDTTMSNTSPLLQCFPR